MFYFRFSLLSIFVIFAGFSLSSQTQLFAPLSKDKLLTITPNNDNYLIKIVDLEGNSLAEQSLGAINELTVRSIQYVGENTYFIDGKQIGFRVRIEGDNISILEKRVVPFDTNGLDNYFYFFTKSKEVHVQYLEENTVKIFIYDENKQLVYSDYSSFTVNNNKNEKGEFPKLIFQPHTQTLTLSSKSNNIWHSIDLYKNNFTQRFYGRLPSGKKGMLYRDLDPFSNQHYQIISNEGTHEIYRVNDFNQTIPLRDNQFLVDTLDQPALFILDNCVYFALKDTIGYGSKCF